MLTQDRYSTGDVVYIQPSNPPEKVCLFLELLGYNPNTLITKITDQMRGTAFFFPKNSSNSIFYNTQYKFSNSEKNPLLKISDQISNSKYSRSSGVPGMTHIPLPITLYNLFLDHVDFLGVPSRYFFELLSFFCTDSMHAERLAYLSSKEGYEELYVSNEEGGRGRMEEGRRVEGGGWRMEDGEWRMEDGGWRWKTGMGMEGGRTKEPRNGVGE
jgi:sulfite reductase alpha subunit-like flavoprotein